MNYSSAKTITLRRVVITGLGAVTPLGNTIDVFWRNLTAGTSGSALITRFDATNFKTKFACEVKAFNPTDYFDAKEAKKLDPYCHYSLVAAEEAVRDAGINLEKIDHTKAGVIWASGMGGLTTLDEQLFDYSGRRGTPRFNPFFIPKIISNMGGGLISIKYGFRGISLSTVSTCASSTNAIADALMYIRLGKADLLIAGGAEAVITESGIGGFNAMKALSERNDSPELASRPFDTGRDGFVMGEGAGALILEELEHAKARGAHIYAEIVGAGFAADAYHMTATHPDGLGAYRAMKDALEDAQLQPADVDYINAHATSTPVGDISEIRAIAKLFDTYLPDLSISATKSMTGHLLGAAGALEAIICIKAIQDSIVPPTINTTDIDPEVPQGADLSLGTARHRSINVAMSNTFGFGGHNAIAVFKKLS